MLITPGIATWRSTQTKIKEDTERERCLNVCTNMLCITRFKNTPVYIDRPAPEEEAVPASVEDIQLPKKTIADLNHIDPFDDMVNKIKL